MQKELNNYICQIWQDVSSISKTYCKGGLPDINNCEWYHSAWCLLRCLDLVSNPFWHEKFYINAIKKISPKDIAIIGTAGISMPYLVSKISNNAEINIIDICKTPLEICKQYSMENGLNWNMIHSNIVNIQDVSKYDLIINDAFLTRFDRNAKKTIIKHIAKLLINEGFYVTSIRKGVYKENGYRSDDMKRKLFVKKAISVGKCKFPQSVDLIKNRAETYINNMLSYPVESIQEIENLFSSVNLKIISVEENYVIGESEETTYYQVIAQKKC